MEDNYFVTLRQLFIFFPPTNLIIPLNILSNSLKLSPEIIICPYLNSTFSLDTIINRYCSPITNIIIPMRLLIKAADIAYTLDSITVTPLEIKEAKVFVNRILRHTGNQELQNLFISHLGHFRVDPPIHKYTHGI